MTHPVGRLTPDEIKEADNLGKRVGHYRGLLDQARDLLGQAAPHTSQSSGRWDQLCANLADALKNHDAATKAEHEWWKSKGFPV